MPYIYPPGFFLGPLPVRSFCWCFLAVIFPLAGHGAPYRYTLKKAPARDPEVVE